MPDPTTPNKDLDLPVTGEYVNAWGPVVNDNFTAIDAALGGTTQISVTSVGAGIYTLTSTQYTPPNIEFTGVVSGSLNYQLPTGVGGLWTISNATTGASTLFLSIAAGNVLTIYPGRNLITSDGATISLADSATIATAAAATLEAAEASAAATYVRLTTTVGNMTGVTIAANPGTTPSGSPGDLFLYY